MEVLTLYQKFLVYTQFFRRMKFSEAVIMCWLISMSEEESTDDGWFECTVHEIKECINLKPAAQTRVLNTLAKKGLIEVTKKGMPPTRRIRVCCDVVQKFIKRK